jgi:hypothetical protein
MKHPPSVRRRFAPASTFPHKGGRKNSAAVLLSSPLVGEDGPKGQEGG